MPWNKKETEIAAWKKKEKMIQNEINKKISRWKEKLSQSGRCIWT